MNMERRPLALVVDDEPDIRELVELTLMRMEVDSVLAADLAEARQQLVAYPVDICLTDMRLPDGSGIDLVRHIQKHRPEVPVAVITAHGSMGSAIEALKGGAFDFVTKPVELQVLRDLVRTALQLSQRKAVKGSGNGGRDPLIGDSDPMQAVKAMIAKVARSQAPVYISGESGTGKELVARLIHSQGPRVDKPFVPVNCGAIPQELMESEFFGHKKGSFTGAVSDKQGLFQAADGGTLFLDEVADLPLHMQVKLLRAIQEKAIRPIGASTENRINVRILSATHRDLAALVREGRFREDLFYRLNVIELKVPPLRERTGDIPLLAHHVLARLAEEMGLPSAHLATDAVAALESYPFPGNVRELENILERALTLCDGEEIHAEDLKLPTATSPSPATGEGEGQNRNGVSLDPLLDQVERETILRALEETGHNKSAAARLLGISFRTLRYRLKKLGVE